jgi:hypothetical protein
MENFSLHISASPLYLILGAIVFAAFAFFIYKFTIPPVSSALRYFLISLRTLVLFLILFLIFEPKLVITNHKTIEPVNYIFYDASRSTALYDSVKYHSIVNSLTNTFEHELTGKKKYFIFSDKAKEISSDEVPNIRLNGILTNFDPAFEMLKKSDDNVSAAIIVTDGTYNDGNDPYYSAENSNVPIFTIGFGDSSVYKDVGVTMIKRNNYIYSGETTAVKALIANSGYAGKNVEVSFYENGKFLQKQKIALSRSGVDEIEFEYKPETAGEKKISVSVSSLRGEKISANNRKSVFVTVLNDKLRVTMISGSPSADFSFIRNVFKRDKKIKLKTLVQISKNRFLEKDNPATVFDSTDVFVLVGFPGNKTSDAFANKVFGEIESRRLPYFSLLGSGTDLSKLKRFSQRLPFAVKGGGQSYANVRVSILSNKSGIFNTAENDLQIWNELPPVLQPNVIFSPRAGTSVLAEAVKGSGNAVNPLIVLERKGSRKSISFLAEEIWRWKLHSKNGSGFLFDAFIENSLKWLSSPDRKKKLIVTANKKEFVAGEEIHFTAELYDETFSPINDAELSLTVKGKDENISIPLFRSANGIYEGKISSLTEGDFSYSVAAKRGGTIEKASGRFSVTAANLELSDLRFRENELRQIAQVSGGVYSQPDSLETALKKLNELAVINKKEKTEIKSIDVWSDERILILLVLLFSIEWFIRKRAGML